MSKGKICFLDSFEIDGTWWHPDHPEQHCAGRLSWNKIELSLKLFGELPTLDPYGKCEKLEVLYGCGSGGYDGLISVFDVFTLSHNELQSGFPTIDLSPSYAAFGAHISATQTFREVRVRLTNLENWCRESPFEFTDNHSTVRHSFKKGKQHRIECLQADLYIDSMLTTSQSHSIRSNDIKLSHSNAIRFELVDGWSIDLVIKRVSDLSNMVSFFLNTKTSPIGVLLNGFESNPPKVSQSRPIDLIWTPAFPFESEEDEPSQRLADLNDIDLYLTTIFNNWFRDADRLTHVHRLFSSVYNSKRVFVDAELLQLSQCLEIYSRTCLSSTYLPVDEYNRVAEKMIVAIPKTVDPSHRNSLKSRIRFGNEYSFRKRLIQICDRLSEEGRSFVSVNIKTTIEKTVSTRNFLVHLDDTTSDQAAKTLSEMVQLALELRKLLTLILFKEMGIPESEAVKILKRSQAWRQFEQ